MLQCWTLHRWLLVALCWIVLWGLTSDVSPVAAQATTRFQVKLMVMVKDAGQASGQTVENTLIRTLQGHGYRVIDASTVAHARSRQTELLQRYEGEAAKRLGISMGADIVISGEAKTRVVEKPYELLGKKQVTTSQADVSAKAILTNSGQVIAADSAHGRKPFDTTGDIALEMAAEALAGKLAQGIEQFFRRDTEDYRLFILNINDTHARQIPDALQRSLQGVRQVREKSFAHNTLHLDVSVERQYDVAFKSDLAMQLSRRGLGHFEVVAREGETIYLRRGGAVSAQAPPAVARQGTPQPPATPVLVKDRRPPAQAPAGDTAPNASLREPLTSETARRPPEETLSREPLASGAPAVLSPQGAPYQRGYHKSWAVVIGINNYQKWPKLEFAVNDARSVRDLLTNAGFDEVITLFDAEATLPRILHVLGDELAAKTQHEDRVFIFFAGHGQTEDLRDGNKVGYIIPVDGEAGNYYSTAISMRQLQDLSDRLRAKHIFFAMDSCFSGLLLRVRGDGAQAYHALEGTQAEARQVLTAGSAGEKVVEFSGHGLFTKVLLEALQGNADSNRDGHITATELYQFVHPRILQASQNGQNPGFGRLGMGRGEFVF
jgi:hypothetical protein